MARNKSDSDRNSALIKQLGTASQIPQKPARPGGFNAFGGVLATRPDAPSPTPPNLGRLNQENQNPDAGTFRTRSTLDRLSFGGGFSVGQGFGGGFGGFNVPRIDLNKFRLAEIRAIERLAALQTKGVRTALEGTIAQANLDKDFQVGQLTRQQRGQQEDISRDVLQRGLLHSGNFAEQAVESDTAFVEQTSHIVNSTAAQVGALQSQIALLAATQAANVAVQRAQIERAYALARNSGF